MTTLAEARADITAALLAVEIDTSAAPGEVAAPAALLFGEGFADLRRARQAGQVVASFRVVLVAGAADQAGAAAMLDNMTLAALGVFGALERYAVNEVRPDTIRRIGAGDYLSRDVVLSTVVDL